MSPQRNESLGTHQQNEVHTQQINDDRDGVIGLLALLGLAFPALGIRYLFPDLNPMFLAGLGIVVYGVYLGLLAYHAFLSNNRNLALKPVVVTERDSHLLSEERNS